MNWLEEFLAECTLTEEVEGYLLGRGAKESTISGEKIVTWKPLPQKAPDEDFRKWCGDRGERLTGYLVCPVRSPKGTLLGFEARCITRKKIMDFRLPESKWCPFWLGLQMGMKKIWGGGNVWVVEGLFDKCPMEWVVPETDAVLASVRAHLTREHVEFLRRYCKGMVHMVYDNDPTGRKPTHGYIDDTGKKVYGAVSRLEKVGLKCRDVPYSGKDPGVIWDKGGVAALKTAFF
ncbi:MAG: toprim domain-containing protein [Bacteroidota bacterium]